MIDGMHATQEADRPVTAHDVWRSLAGYVRIRRERSPTGIIMERDWMLIKLVRENREEGQKGHLPGCAC